MSIDNVLCIATVVPAEQLFVFDSMGYFVNKNKRFKETNLKNVCVFISNFICVIIYINTHTYAYIIISKQETLYYENNFPCVSFIIQLEFNNWRVSFDVEDRTNNTNSKKKDQGICRILDQYQFCVQYLIYLKWLYIVFFNKKVCHLIFSYQHGFIKDRSTFMNLSSSLVVVTSPTVKC